MHLGSQSASLIHGNKRLSPAGSEHNRHVKANSNEAADSLALTYALPADLQCVVNAWSQLSARAKAAILKLAVEPHELSVEIQAQVGEKLERVAE
jgi:hypothetical protein